MCVRLRETECVCVCVHISACVHACKHVYECEGAQVHVYAHTCVCGCVLDREGSKVFASS